VKGPLEFPPHSDFTVDNGCGPNSFHSAGKKANLGIYSCASAPWSEAMSASGPSRGPSIVGFRRAADTVVGGQPNLRAGWPSRRWAFERHERSHHEQARMVLRDRLAWNGVSTWSSFLQNRERGSRLEEATSKQTTKDLRDGPISKSQWARSRD
jgi:hypothetical protein